MAAKNGGAAKKGTVATSPAGRVPSKRELQMLQQRERAIARLHAARQDKEQAKADLAKVDAGLLRIGAAYLVLGHERCW
jgi:hypothetical protein